MADIFYSFFAATSSYFFRKTDSNFRITVRSLKTDYVGHETKNNKVDAEFTEKIFEKLSRGKASGFDSLTVENILFRHLSVRSVGSI